MDLNSPVFWFGILIKFEDPPVIEPLRNRTVVEGSPLTVSCHVIDGNPSETTFEWERNGQIWKTTREFTIDATSRTDAMFYTCEVTNKMQQKGEQQVAQTNTSSILADVEINTVNNSISENDSVITLSCTLTGTSETVQSFTWYLKKISENDSAVVGKLTSSCESDIGPIDTSVYGFACPSSSQNTWTIKKVSRQNQGDTYQCTIETPSGRQDSGYIFLIVQDPVSSVKMIIPSTSVVTVRENEENEFKCKTDGSLPAAIINWYKDSGTPDIPGDDVEIASKIETSYSVVNNFVEVTSTLRYSPSRYDNGWRLYCSARDIHDMIPVISERKPLLNVHYPPVVGELRNRTVVEGSPVTVSCPVIVGNPTETTFEWKRNGQIWKTTQEFTIDTTSRIDAMFYTCKVNNKMQQTSKLPVSQSDTKALYLNVLCSSNTTGIIIGVTLGIVCTILAAYAAYLMYLNRRKSTKTDATSPNESTQLRTYQTLNPKLYTGESNTDDVNGEKDDTARQYTDLARYPKDDWTTYDVIQLSE